MFLCFVWVWSLNLKSLVDNGWFVRVVLDFANFRGLRVLD